jgi:hypothetical protein
MARKASDLRRKRFGRLVAIRRVYRKKASYWECLCDCGKTTLVRRDHLVQGHSQSCGCLQIEKTINRCWKGHEEISGKYWYDLNRNAKFRLVDFEITIDEAWKIFLFQNRRCYFTGDLLCFAKGKSDSKCQTASLDRLDNKLGYTKENCRWVHKSVNRLKNDFALEEFLALCSKVSEYEKTKNSSFA